MLDMILQNYRFFLSIVQPYFDSGELSKWISFQLRCVYNCVDNFIMNAEKTGMFMHLHFFYQLGSEQWSDRRRGND